MNESSPVSLTKNSSNQLKKTCLSSCERLTQSIESASAWEFWACFGGRLNRLVGGGPGVGGFEDRGEAEGEGECEGAPGRVVRIIGGGGLSESGRDLPEFEGRGGGGGLDLGSTFLEGLFCTECPLSDLRNAKLGDGRKRGCSLGIGLWHC